MALTEEQLAASWCEGIDEAQEIDEAFQLLVELETAAVHEDLVERGLVGRCEWPRGQDPIQLEGPGFPAWLSDYAAYLVTPASA